MIDSHQHFWKYNEKDYGWINSEMAVLRKDYLPGTLELELKNIGFDGSIAVQARQSLEETEWLLRLADEFDFIKGVVGWVDLRSPDVEKQLEKYAQHPKLVGLRHVVQDEPDDDFILQPDFLRGISLLEKYDLTYDILIFPKHLPNTIKFVEMFPGQRFVLDHIAKPLIKENKIASWAEHIIELASFPNVFCKVSGMVTEAHWQRWKYEDFLPYLDVIFQSFGPNRTLIGSDWPVCRLAGEYSTVMGIVFQYCMRFSPVERKNIYGGNAEKAYNLT